MELNADPFSASQISQSCWAVCHDVETIAADLLPTSMPIYRDEETRAQFENVVNFFGCMSNCEERYIVKRVAVIVPIATVGKYLTLCTGNGVRVEGNFLFCSGMHYWSDALLLLGLSTQLLSLQKALLQKA